MAGATCAARRLKGRALQEAAKVDFVPGIAGGAGAPRWWVVVVAVGGGYRGWLWLISQELLLGLTWNHYVSWVGSPSQAVKYGE